MDRMRPIYVRQKSNSSGAPGTPTSPTSNSPAHHHTRSGSLGMVGGKKAQNTKAAAQKLANAMASKYTVDDDEDDDDDFSYDPGGSLSSGAGGILGGATGRAIRPRSPMKVRTAQDQPSSTRISLGAGRSALSVKTVEQQQPSSTHLTPATRTFQSVTHSEQSSSASSRSALNTRPISNVDQSPFSLRSSINSRSSQNINSQEQPSSARSTSGDVQPQSFRTSLANRSSNFGTSNNEQPNSARSLAAAATRPQLGTKPVHMVPATVPISLRPSPSADAAPAESRRDPPVPILLRPPSSAMLNSEGSGDKLRDKRMSFDFGSMNLRDSGSQNSSALQDELDMLHEENDTLLEKLRLAEERCEETEARARQLEKQVASLGEGVTLEARLLSKKEAQLQQREAALRMAAQTHDDRNDEAESELQTIRIITQRMILTREEKEDVVLKRSWLARYWSLCVQHGIHAEMAKAKYEFWSSLAPLPVESVLEAGKKAKEQIDDNSDPYDREHTPRDMNDLSGDGNIENMLLVEQGLRELALLKVEDAVALAMAHHRCPASKSGLSELKVPGADGQFEGYELSKEESDDVFFKQAWLTYFWRRAKNHGLEQDIADDRLKFWINRETKSPTSHDAVDVERGLMELRKLGIEIQLWEESRKDLEHESIPRIRQQTDF